MDITNIDREYIEAKKQRIRKRHYSQTFDNNSFDIGWDAAIRFAREICKSEAICEQCGKLIPSGEGNIDCGGSWFCNKCYKRI